MAGAEGAKGREGGGEGREGTGHLIFRGALGVRDCHSSPHCTDESNEAHRQGFALSLPR